MNTLVALVLWIMSLYMNQPPTPDVVLLPAQTVTRHAPSAPEAPAEPDPLTCWLPAVELTAEGGHPNPMLPDSFAGAWAQVTVTKNGPILRGIEQVELWPELPRCDY